MQFCTKTLAIKTLKILLGLLLLAYFFFTARTPIIAEENRNPIREAAFALIDKGEHKQAVPKLESLLQTDLSRLEKLEIRHTLGYLYEKLLNRPKAVGHYVRVITHDYPLADSAAYRLAKLYEGMKNDPKAIKWYEHLVKNYPQSSYLTDATWNLAQLHLKQKHYADAKTYFVQILEEPRFAREAAYALARCEEGLNNFSTAFQMHQKLIAEKQSDTVAEDSVRKLKMLASEKKSLILTTSDRLNCGLVHYYHKNWKSAIAELTPFTKRSDLKLRGRALYYIGQSFQGRDWYNTAIKSYNSVIALGDKTYYLTRAHYQIAQCYRLKGSLTTTVNRLESFVKTYSWSELVDNALYDIAQIHEKRGKSELALKTYSRLIEVAPGSEYADWAAWRIGWQRFDEKRYEESYKAF